MVRNEVRQGVESLQGANSPLELRFGVENKRICEGNQELGAWLGELLDVCPLALALFSSSREEELPAEPLDL